MGRQGIPDPVGDFYHYNRCQNCSFWRGLFFIAVACFIAAVAVELCR